MLVKKKRSSLFSKKCYDEERGLSLVEHLSSGPLLGRLPALPANIRLGCNACEGKTL